MDDGIWKLVRLFPGAYSSDVPVCGQAPKRVTDVFHHSSGTLEVCAPGGSARSLFPALSEIAG
jgi:hypothetical protein